MTDDPIPDKVRAQVLRETADDLAEHHFFDGAADVLHREANRLDPPEPAFTDGDYAVWDQHDVRWPAVRCNAVWSVVAHVNRYTDAEMPASFTRIERLRVASEDQVIVDAVDAARVTEWAFDKALHSGCPGLMWAAIRRIHEAAQAARTGGESSGA